MGVGFPSVIKDNICCTASNISDDWLDVNMKAYFEDLSGLECSVVNDADAAGLAELHFGKIKDLKGTVILLTLGTGIGSAIFNDGQLVKNTELGHLLFKGEKAEHLISNKARKENELSWKEWGSSLNEYLEHIDFVFSPNLIVLGGGVSKKLDNYKKYFNPALNITNAKQLNEAGVIGAAIAV